MSTQYLTFVLRLRLDDSQPRQTADRKVFGSVQQVGLQEIHYFDTVEKFEEALQKLLISMSLPSQTQMNEVRKSSQSILAATGKHFK